MSVLTGFPCHPGPRQDPLSGQGAGTGRSSAGGGGGYGGRRRVRGRNGGEGGKGASTQGAFLTPRGAGPGHGRGLVLHPGGQYRQMGCTLPYTLS